MAIVLGSVSELSVWRAGFVIVFSLLAFGCGRAGTGPERDSCDDAGALVKGVIVPPEYKVPPGLGLDWLYMGKPVSETIARVSSEYMEARIPGYVHAPYLNGGGDVELYVAVESDRSVGPRKENPAVGQLWRGTGTFAKRRVSPSRLPQVPLVVIQWTSDTERLIVLAEQSPLGREREPVPPDFIEAWCHGLHLEALIESGEYICAFQRFLSGGLYYHFRLRGKNIRHYARAETVLDELVASWARCRSPAE